MKAFPQTKHWHGFSPGGKRCGESTTPKSPQKSLGEKSSRVLTGVDADVALQSPGVGKLALAVDADVGFLPAVDPEVPFEVP